VAKPVVPKLARTPAQAPVVSVPPRAKYWSFSFRYWRQTDLFPLSERAAWFASLLGRLKELGQLEIEQFVRSSKTRDVHRYHEIDWNARNIPIQRRDMTWIPNDYRNNETEYPLIQFAISKAVGRVVGFWDEYQVFNIVALDTLHNLQPSVRFNYTVRYQTPLKCEYTSLLHDVQAARAAECDNRNCASRVALDRIPTDGHDHEVLIIRLDNGTMEMINELELAGCSIRDIFETGIILKTDEIEAKKKADQK
jgi:hypothetical protein